MFSKAFLLINLFALTLAEPIPQAAATTDFSFPTGSYSYSLPASLESQLSEASVLESIFSGAPTLPASIESALVAAIPTTITYATNQLINCDIATATPEWYATLPASVKNAISSYDSAFLSWYEAHSAEIASAEGTLSGTNTFAVPTGCGATVSVATTAATTGKGATTTGAGATGGTGSSTASASAGSGTSTSKGAAPRATGAIALSAAGLAGVLGLMAAL